MWLRHPSRFPSGCCDLLRLGESWKEPIFSNVYILQPEISSSTVNMTVVVFFFWCMLLKISPELFSNT